MFFVENVDRVIKLINKYYYSDEEINVMEKYLDVLLENFLRQGYVFDNFPFKLFNCHDKLDFLTKYLDTCTPHLISKDIGQLRDIANHLKMSENQIIMVSLSTKITLFILVLCFKMTAIKYTCL